MPVDYTNLVPATYLIYRLSYRCTAYLPTSTDVLTYKFYSGTGIINQDNAGKIPLSGKIYYCT